MLLAKWQNLRVRYGDSTEVDTLEWLYPAMRIQPYPRLATYCIARTCQIRSYASQVPFEPLRILFCGSDEFSIASLRALYKEHERDKALIESIDVVSRPPKPVGRGLKDTREGEFSQAGPPCSFSIEKQCPFL